MRFSRRDVMGLVAPFCAAAMPTPAAFAQRAHDPRHGESQMVQTRIGRLGFELGMPTHDTVAKLYDEMDFQRAVQCYLWATPIVGMQGVREALADNAGAVAGDLVVVEGYRDVSVMLGSNLTTPYFFVALDLAASGPVVMEYPAGATGSSLIDWWDRPIADLGLAGADKGEGATLIIVGPGQEVPRDVPATSRVLTSRTFGVLLFGRVLEPDGQKARAMLGELRAYPHSRRAEAPRTRLLRFRKDGTLTGMGHPRGMAYWRRLANALRSEVVEDRDRFFAAMLKPLGIEKGQAFAPTHRQQALLDEAAVVGEAMARAAAFDKRFPRMRYRDDAQWEFLIPPDMDFAQDVGDSTLFEERTAFFYEVMGASQAVLTTTPGVGSAYLSAYHDRDGHALDGGRRYRLHVPANPPAKLFWSVTLYDAQTRCLVQNPRQIADRSSRQDLLKNPDGSVEIVFGPAPRAGREKNWIPTEPGKAWFAYFRLFGPLEGYFDRSWRLGDIEMMAG